LSPLIVQLFKLSADIILVVPTLSNVVLKRLDFPIDHFQTPVRPTKDSVLAANLLEGRQAHTQLFCHILCRKMQIFSELGSCYLLGRSAF